MADPIQNPRIRYDVILPGGERRNREGAVTGFIRSARKGVLPLLLQTLPKGSTVENLRMIHQDGKELDKQPAAFAELDSDESAETRRAVTETAITTDGGHVAQ